MTQILIFTLLMMNSVIFLMMNHPLTLGFILMIQTILMSLFTGMFTLMFWFSYSLFLIFMGGMLILFMYMTSLASNETFKFTINMKMVYFLFFFISFSFYSFFFFDFKNLIFNNQILNNENFSLYYWMNSIEKNNFLLNKMFNFPINFITILLVNYLFLTLIAVVKITNIFSGPLRPKQF